jgi:hypothetical protein
MVGSYRCARGRGRGPVRDEIQYQLATKAVNHLSQISS